MKSFLETMDRPVLQLGCGRDGLTVAPVQPVGRKRATRQSAIARNERRTRKTMRRYGEITETIRHIARTRPHFTWRDIQAAGIESTPMALTSYLWQMTYRGELQCVKKGKCGVGGAPAVFTSGQATKPNDPVTI